MPDRSARVGWLSAGCHMALAFHDTGGGVLAPRHQTSTPGEGWANGGGSSARRGHGLGAPGLVG